MKISDVFSSFTIAPELLTTLKYVAAFAGIVLIVAILGRVTMGKRSSLNHAVSSAMGILFMYVLSIVIYSFDPDQLIRFLSPLPYITLSGNQLSILSFSDAGLQTISYQVLSMLILAFLVNLIDTWIPKGKKITSWYGYRLLTVLISTVIHYAVTWVLQKYMPGTLASYAPIILLCILGSFLILGFLNIILSLVLTVANPIIGALYTFFFSNLLGKQITKSVITTIIISTVAFVLNYLGYHVISISPESLITCIPVFPTLLILWYIIGQIF